jgi:hypothetical protein
VVLQLGGWAWSYQLFTFKNKLVTKCHKGPQTSTDYLDKRPKLRKMDMRFGAWNVGSLLRAGFLMAIAEVKYDGAIPALLHTSSWRGA